MPRERAPTRPLYPPQALSYEKRQRSDPNQHQKMKKASISCKSKSRSLCKIATLKRRKKNQQKIERKNARSKKRKRRWKTRFKESRECGKKGGWEICRRGVSRFPLIFSSFSFQKQRDGGCRQSCYQQWSKSFDSPTQYPSNWRESTTQQHNEMKVTSEDTEIAGNINGIAIIKESDKSTRIGKIGKEEPTRTQRKNVGRKIRFCIPSLLTHVPCLRIDHYYVYMDMVMIEYYEYSISMQYVLYEILLVCTRSDCLGKLNSTRNMPLRSRLKIQECSFNLWFSINRFKTMIKKYTKIPFQSCSKKVKMSENKISFKDKICEIPKKYVPLENGETKETNEKQNNERVSGKDGEPSKQTKDKGKAPMEDCSSMNLESYVQHLAKVKSDFSKIKETSLMGRIFAITLDFSKVRSKLFAEWKNIKGEVSIIPRPNNWFEINFSNPIDKAMVWDKRPYHVFGHLLILRSWKPNFNVFTENISAIDVWARIPLLPVEYVNKEAIRAIIEFNKIGKFIRLDSFSEKGMGISYARICLNVDFEKKPKGDVPIPDEKGDPAIYTIWYEDFTKGCGFCGQEEHVFDSCPLRLAPAKKNSFTIRKSNKWKNAKKKDEDKDWTPAVGYKKKRTSIAAIGGIKPYLAEGSGVSISFIDGSSQSSKNSSKGSGNIDKNCDPKALGDSKIEGANPCDDQADRKAKESVQPLFDNLDQFDTSKEDEAFAAAMIVEPEINETAKILLHDGILGAETLQNTPAPIDEGIMISEGSFQSFHTNNTMHRQLEAMEVKNDVSNSDSSKKKKYGGIEDTATSALKGTKKQRI